MSDNVIYVYYYTSNGGVNRIAEYTKNDLTLIQESPNIPWQGDGFTKSGDYLYAVSGGRYIRKYNANDLSYTNVESPDYGDTINCITSDDEFIYVGGDVQKIRRYKQSDLTYVDESGTVGVSRDVIISGDYLYSCTNVIYKHRLSDLVVVNTSPSYGNTIESIRVSGDYIYAGGRMNKIRKYNLNDLTYTNVESPDYGGRIFALDISGDYIYAGGQTTQRIRKYNLNDLTYTNIQSDDYGGIIRSIVISDGNIFSIDSQRYLKNSDLSTLNLNSQRLFGNTISLKDILTSTANLPVIDLTVTSNIDSVCLEWTNQSIDKDLNVYYDYSTGSTWQLFQTLSPSATTTCVTGLTNGVEYKFVVTKNKIDECNGVGDGTYSLSQFKISNPTYVEPFDYQWFDNSGNPIIGETGITITGACTERHILRIRDSKTPIKHTEFYELYITSPDAIYSNIVYETPISLIIIPPSGLTATNITYTGATLTWVNNSFIGDNNVIQRWTGSAWVNVATIALSADTYQLTGLTVNTTYTYRVSVLYEGIYYPSNSVVFTTLLPLPPFCDGDNYTISATTCGNSDGSINITNEDYLIFYNFTLTDALNNTYTYPYTGLTAGFYNLTATPKPEFWSFYGRDACYNDWLMLEASDTTITLDGISIKPSQCSGFDTQLGRIFYSISDTLTGSTYTFYLFPEIGATIYATGQTKSQLIHTGTGCYRAMIINEDNDCTLLVDLKCIPEIDMRSISGVKQLFIAPVTGDTDLNYWSTADENFFLEEEDSAFFLSTKIKEYVTEFEWYGIPVHNGQIELKQVLNKQRQGFIFSDTLNIGIAAQTAEKLQDLLFLIENKWVYVLQDSNGNWWTGGYKIPAELNVVRLQTGRRGDSNEYQLEIEAISADNILTAIAENYVNTKILQ